MGSRNCRTEARRWRIALAVAAMSVLGVACTDVNPVAPGGTSPTLPPVTPPRPPGVPLSSLVPPGAVQPAIQQEPQAADGTVTYVVRIVANAVAVSAYQGEVTFSPDVFQLVSVTPPPNASDVISLVNAAEFPAGRLRFAGCTATIFAGTDVGDGIVAFRFTVRVLGDIAHANISATVAVVGTELGAGVAPEHLLRSPATVSLAVAGSR